MINEKAVVGSALGESQLEERWSKDGELEGSIGASIFEAEELKS